MPKKKTTTKATPAPKATRPGIGGKANPKTETPEPFNARGEDTGPEAPVELPPEVVALMDIPPPPPMMEAHAGEIVVPPPVVEPEPMPHITMEMETVDPYAYVKEGLALKIPADAGQEYSELPSDTPLLEFLSDFPAHVILRQSIHVAIERMEERKKKISSDLYAALALVGLPRLRVGRFHTQQVIPVKEQEKFDKAKLIEFLLKMLPSQFALMVDGEQKVFTSSDFVTAAINAATTKTPPKEPYLLVLDLAGEPKPEIGS